MMDLRRGPLNTIHVFRIYQEKIRYEKRALFSFGLH